MTISEGCSQRLLGLGLIFAVGLTRLPELGTLDLPDASLAAFFLSGLYHSSGRLFGLLLLAALLADLFAFRFGLAPPDCLTAAYWFLVPTYYLVWAAGQSMHRLAAATGTSRWWAQGLFRATLALLGAFLLSNAAYYVFAIDDAAMSGMRYASSVAQYFPAYAGETLSYVIPVLVAERWRARGRRPEPAAA
jgi:hypothetical protein